MFSLLNRGIIPKDVDLSPAFERGSAPFMFTKAKMFAKPPYVPISQKTMLAVTGGSKLGYIKHEQPVLDDGNQQTTFLTALGGNPLATANMQQPHQQS